MAHYAIYVRRSYKRADSAAVSDETQEQMARSLLPAGATAEVITDSGGHHSGASTDRDGYRELVSRLRSGAIDGIAVYDLSRLHRNARNMLDLSEELERRRIPLLVATMPASRFDSATGRFLFGQLALAAQLQRDLDSERMAAQCRAIFEAGGHRGLDPFGYRSTGEKPRTLAIVDSEAETVRRVWSELAQRSTEEIAEGLNREGILHRTDRAWTRDAVKDIARRGRFYLGYVTYRRGLEERPGRHPAILDEPTWRDGMAAMHRRVRGSVRRSVRHRSYLLAGLLHCGLCEGRMRGQPSVSRGREWLYYRCRACRNVLPAETAHADLLSRISGMVLPAADIEAAREELRRAVPGDDGKLRRRLTQRLERLVQAYTWGDLTEAQYRSQKSETERDMAMLPDRDKLVLFDGHRRVMVSMAENIEAATPEQLRELVQLLVARITAISGVVTDIDWTGPARPFFGAVASAPPDGLEHPVDTLGWYREAM